MTAEEFLPGGHQNQIHLGSPQSSNPVNVNLEIGHQPMESFECGNLTQRLAAHFPTAPSYHHSNAEPEALCLGDFYFQTVRPIKDDTPVVFCDEHNRKSEESFADAAIGGTASMGDKAV